MTAPQPAEPWAAAEAAAMSVGELALMTALTQQLLTRLTRLWVTLFGSVTVLPSEAAMRPVEAGRAAARTPVSAPGGHAGAGRTQLRDGPAPIDFPPVWHDTVDDGLRAVLDAMDAAADAVQREVPAADTAAAKAYRIDRMRRALAPSSVTKRGFAAVQEAIAQPAKLESDVRGVVTGELVADHTDTVREQAAGLGDEWVTIWIPERDACVRCLAYAGLWVTPAAAQLFPGGRTWGPRWKSVISRPDFRGPGWRETESGEHEGSHPHCRCELRLVRRTGVHTMATALKREAARSAAKGWARPTEGDTERVAAAKHVLTTRATLPQSVVAETRHRLRNPKTFPRAVPSPSR